MVNLRRWRRLGVLFSCMLLAVTLMNASPAEAHPSGRIINGLAVSAERQVDMWPFVVSIGNKGRTARASHSCGGSLIAPNLVLTAAHCFEEIEEGIDYKTLPNGVTVTAGVNALSEEKLGQRRSVKDVFIHPKWNTASGINDLAILRLQAPMVLNDRVKVISPIQPANDAWWGNGAGIVGSEATGPWAAGWGNVIAWGKGDAYPNGLFQVQFPIASDTACASTQEPGLSDDNGIINTTLFLCGGIPDSDADANNGTTGKDTCQGDSGGPLVVGDGLGQWQQVGIVSYGGLCGAATYGAYTRVASYRAWIATARTAGGGMGGINPVPVARMTRSARTSVTLSWNAPKGGAFSYAVYVAYTDGTMSRVALTPKRAAFIRNLESDSIYTFYVVARDRIGNDSPMRKVNASTAF